MQNLQFIDLVYMFERRGRKENEDKDREKARKRKQL